MNKQYSYPLDLSWSTEELASVLSFNDVEAAYEGKVEAKSYWTLIRGSRRSCQVRAKRNVWDENLKQ